MNQGIDFVTANWLAVLLVALALAPAAWMLLRRWRHGTYSVPLLTLTALLALTGVGGLTLKATWAVWLLLGGAALAVLGLVGVLRGRGRV